MMIRNNCFCFSVIFGIFFSILVQSLASPTPHFCRHDQRDALLEFKDEFSTDEYDPIPWNKSSDCCFWKGVTCDDKSGQVISLDLSYYSVNVAVKINVFLKTNSSLFRLQYLRHLNLTGCSLQGEIPSSLGNLSHLTLVDLSWNHLERMIPDSIGDLKQLKHLSLGHNTLIGEIPSSLGNLSRLENLHLYTNHLVGEVPASIGNLNKLKSLWLYENSLSGSLSSSFANLTKLSDFSIRSNNFTSTLPSNMSGFLPNLELFLVGNNLFFGPFPKSLFSIPSLRYVDLEGNQFTGPIDFENTSSSSSELYSINLGGNRFDGPIPESIFKFLSLESLYLQHNNFTGQIPRSMSKLVNLSYLDLSYNMLEGQVPACLWRLMTVTLSRNFFSSLENSSSQERLIQLLDLNSNSFRAPFPAWICKLRSLGFLDLSNNSFSGSIPTCLSNLTAVRELILGNNSFSGTLPDINATNLQSFDVSRNQLEGKLPKSLINCKALELVNVGSNRIKDEFPSWLGSLPSLHVLILRSNDFYGPLFHRHVSVGFQSLRVIDVSHNDFTGTLPPHSFSNWRGMTTTEQIEEYSQYMVYNWNLTEYRNSMVMVIKGVETSFEWIRKDFRAIDFSGNRFYGEIPESIGLLKELRLLNLSGNAFTSYIPPSLANLTNLETLDLSRNKLSGQIPQDLGEISFLSYMNFSSNLLEGPVPRGTQFQRQNCSSFLDNPRLYGLEDICGKSHVGNPTSQQSEEVSELEEPMFNWVAAAIAYGPGVFCGLVIGHIFTSHNHECFAEKFGRRKLRVTRSDR